MPEPRLFTIVRRGDESGVSGTGRVLDGVVLHNGEVVVIWRSDVRQRDPDQPAYTSICIYPCWEAFQHIHIDAHPSNKTEVVFGNDANLDVEVEALWANKWSDFARPDSDAPAGGEPERPAGQQTGAVED